MSFEGFYLLPHPPIVVPEIGKGEEKKIQATSSGFDQIAKEIAEKSPDTIITVTPHGTMFQDAVAICGEHELNGSFENFSVPGVSMKVHINTALASSIYEFAQQENIPSIMATDGFLNKYNSYEFLDHGVMVPLYFINKYYKAYKLVHITYAPIGDLDLYRFGMCIRKAVEKSNEKIVMIASGDLSHRLKEHGPYGYNPYGEKFDKEFLDCLKNGDVEGVFSIDRDTLINAGECGRRSVVMMLGALDKKKFNGELLSYEGTFGVGYGVMKFNVISENTSMLDKLETARKTAYERKKEGTDPYARLARESLTHYLVSGEELEEFPNYVPDEMKSIKRGVFVSLKKHGELRGCIGTIFPVTDSVAEEIMRNAVEAGMNDPRFYEVEEDELIDIDFSVDVLTEPEPADKEELDPHEYGVIVRSGRKTGLLLPDLEGVDTVEKQLDIALQKAGIGSAEEYKIERFKVLRHKES